MLPHVPPDSKELSTLMKEAQLLVVELEGALTDGTTTVDHQGNESFSVSRLDVEGFKTWQDNGGKLVVVARRTLPGAQVWCEKMGLAFRPHGGKKSHLLRPILLENQVEEAQVCYLGSGMDDLPPMLACGVSAAPRQASVWVRDAAHLTMENSGGAGAVRELVEKLMDGRGLVGG